jgi:hypothetical protein
MGFFTSIKRKAVPIEIEGEKYFVRSLTENEVKQLPNVDLEALKDQPTEVAERALSDRAFSMLMAGVCDAKGNPVINEDDRDTINDAPKSVLRELIDKIIDLASPKKN